MLMFKVLEFVDVCYTMPFAPPHITSGIFLKKMWSRCLWMFLKEQMVGLCLCQTGKNGLLLNS